MVKIGRLRSQYLVPRDHPAPEEVRARLDRLQRDQLAAACGAMFDRILDPNDPSVWIIRRLELECIVDAAVAEPDQLAGLYSERIAHSLMQTLRYGPDGESVLRFANRAEYLAWFVRDLIAGVAWERWYYRSFEELGVFPLSAAIREVLVRAPEHAAAALICLHHLGQTMPLLASLHPNDVRTIHLLATREATPADSATTARILLAAWVGTTRQKPAGAEHTALHLGIVDGFKHADEITRHFTAAMLLLSEARGLPVSKFPQEWRAEGLALLKILQTAAPELPGEMAAAFELKQVPAATGARLMESQFTAAFLLLKSLADLAPPEVLQSSLSRVRVLAKCMDPRFERWALSDPVIHLAAGSDGSVEPTPAPEAEIDDLAGRILRHWTLRLPGFQECSPAFLRENFFDGPGSVVITPEGVHVHLPIVPLRIILRMACVDGDEFNLPWEPQTRITLHLPEE